MIMLKIDSSTNIEKKMINKLDANEDREILVNNPFLPIDPISMNFLKKKRFQREYYVCLSQGEFTKKNNNTIDLSAVEKWR